MVKVPDCCSLIEFVDKTSFDGRNAQNTLSFYKHQPSAELVST